MTKKLIKLPPGLPGESDVIKNDAPEVMFVKETLAALHTADGVAAEAVQAAVGGGVGMTKITFSDTEGPKVEQVPNWAVDTPDPHVPWPDLRPEPPSDAHGMDFGDAIRCMKRGQRVARAGWNGKGMWLEYVSDAEMGPLGLRLEPFISMFTAQQKRIPWLASQADMLANDWRVVG